MSDPNSSASVQAAPEDPGFIKYLFNPNLKYKCHFLVGNEALNIAVERIGVVKKMLFAHSNVLWAAIEESPIAEKDKIRVTDLYPDTFRNLLRFVYGYDITASLTFTDADNLLYAAEKYNISSLKSKVCSRLMALLTYDNICGLLNNPACYQALELNAAVTQILQYETEKVLQSPQFLELSPSAFLHILQQDRLQVQEIELWRSAIKWAKNRVGSADGTELRSELTEHVRHIRVCSLTSEEFCAEVVPSRVLTDSEVAMVHLSLGTGQNQPELKQICSNVERRLEASSELLSVTIPTHTSCGGYTASIAIIATKQRKIKLMSLRFCSTRMKSVKGAVTINGPFAGESDSEPEKEIVVNINIQAVRDREYDVDVVNNGYNVQLLPHSQYTVNVTLEDCRAAYVMGRQNHNFTHFNVNVGEKPCGMYVCHFKTIQYKTLM